PRGDWSNWDPLGKPPTIIGVVPLPAVRVNDDGRLEVFLAGSDNALWHIWQVAPNGTWSNWESIGRPPNIGSISSPSVGAEEDGRVEVFVTASDNALWHIAQVAPN